MGQRSAAMPDSTLERVARSSDFSDAARRHARKELERRQRTDGHCPRGKGCTKWNCEASHD